MAVAVQLQLGSGELFRGIVDMVRQVEIVYDDESLGKKYVEGPVPVALQARVTELRHQMLEAVVEHDDAILHKYLEEHELTEDEIDRKSTRLNSSHSQISYAVFCLKKKKKKK